MDKKDALKTIPEECRYSFFNHASCEFFPCHTTEHPEDFNCLFCYCPLYVLGASCGGNFSYTENGIKDCSKCMAPHTRKSYSYIAGRFSELAALAKEKRKS
jgi:Zn-finger protein